MNTQALLQTNLIAFGRRFVANRSGTPTVEFALIAPLLIALFLGTVELSSVMTANRKVENVASVAADITAQAQQIDNGDIADVFQAAQSILSPFDPASVSIIVTSVEADLLGKTTVGWSDGYNTVPHTKGIDFAVPAAMVIPGGSIILAEVQYDYSTNLKIFMNGQVTITDKFFARPRRVLKIQRKI